MDRMIGPQELQVLCVITQENAYYQLSSCIPLQFFKQSCKSENFMCIIILFILFLLRKIKYREYLTSKHLLVTNNLHASAFHLYVIPWKRCFYFYFTGEETEVRMSCNSKHAIRIRDYLTSAHNLPPQSNWPQTFIFPACFEVSKI